MAVLIAIFIGCDIFNIPVATLFCRAMHVMQLVSHAFAASDESLSVGANRVLGLALDR